MVLVAKSNVVPDLFFTAGLAGATASGGGGAPTSGHPWISIVDIN